MNAGESHENSLKIANIWANIEYLGCIYEEEVAAKSKEYGDGV